MFYVRSCHSQNHSKELWLSELPEMTKTVETLCSFLPYISLLSYSQTAFINRPDFCISRFIDRYYKTPGSNLGHSTADSDKFSVIISSSSNLMQGQDFGWGATAFCKSLPIRCFPFTPKLTLNSLIHWERRYVKHRGLIFYNVSRTTYIILRAARRFSYLHLVKISPRLEMFMLTFWQRIFFFKF